MIRPRSASGSGGGGKSDDFDERVRSRPKLVRLNPEDLTNDTLMTDLVEREQDFEADELAKKKLRAAKNKELLERDVRQNGKLNSALQQLFKALRQMYKAEASTAVVLVLNKTSTYTLSQVMKYLLDLDDLFAGATTSVSEALTAWTKRKEKVLTTILKQNRPALSSVVVSGLQALTTLELQEDAPQLFLAVQAAISRDEMPTAERRQQLPAADFNVARMIASLIGRKHRTLSRDVFWAWLGALGSGIRGWRYWDAVLHEFMVDQKVAYDDFKAELLDFIQHPEDDSDRLRWLQMIQTQVAVDELVLGERFRKSDIPDLGWYVCGELPIRALELNYPVENDIVSLRDWKLFVLDGFKEIASRASNSSFFSGCVDGVCSYHLTTLRRLQRRVPDTVAYKELFEPVLQILYEKQKHRLASVIEKNLVLLGEVPSLVPEAQQKYRASVSPADAMLALLEDEKRKVDMNKVFEGVADGRKWNVEVVSFTSKRDSAQWFDDIARVVLSDDLDNDVKRQILRAALATLQPEPVAIVAAKIFHESNVITLTAEDLPDPFHFFSGQIADEEDAVAKVAWMENLPRSFLRRVASCVMAVARAKIPVAPDVAMYVACDEDVFRKIFPPTRSSELVAALGAPVQPNRTHNSTKLSLMTIKAAGLFEYESLYKTCKYLSDTCGYQFDREDFDGLANYGREWGGWKRWNSMAVRARLNPDKEEDYRTLTDYENWMARLEQTRQLVPLLRDAVREMKRMLDGIIVKGTLKHVKSKHVTHDGHTLSSDVLLTMLDLDYFKGYPALLESYNSTSSYKNLVRVDKDGPFARFGPRSLDTKFIVVIANVMWREWFQRLGLGSTLLRNVEQTLTRAGSAASTAMLNYVHAPLFFLTDTRYGWQDFSADRTEDWSTQTERRNIFDYFPIAVVHEEAGKIAMHRYWLTPLERLQWGIIKRKVPAYSATGFAAAAQAINSVLAPPADEKHKPAKAHESKFDFGTQKETKVHVTILTAPMDARDNARLVRIKHHLIWLGNVDASVLAVHITAFDVTGTAWERNTDHGKVERIIQLFLQYLVDVCRVWARPLHLAPAVVQRIRELLACRDLSDSEMLKKLWHDNGAPEEQPFPLFHAGSDGLEWIPMTRPRSVGTSSATSAGVAKLLPWEFLRTPQYDPRGSTEPQGNALTYVWPPPEFEDPARGEVSDKTHVKGAKENAEIDPEGPVYRPPIEAPFLAYHYHLH